MQLKFKELEKYLSVFLMGKRFLLTKWDKASKH